VSLRDILVTDRGGSGRQAAAAEPGRVVREAHAGNPAAIEVMDV
jgi:hypothetical protein